MLIIRTFAKCSAERVERLEHLVADKNLAALTLQSQEYTAPLPSLTH